MSFHGPDTIAVA